MALSPTDPRFQRTRALLGGTAMERLASARVAVVGLGGVGGACAEALARSGIGELILMDHDTVDLSNCNRQLFATSATVGLPKTEAACRRIREIIPDIRLFPVPAFYSADTPGLLFDLAPTLVIDAVDTVTSKLALAAACREYGIPSICCLGTGNRLDPSAFRLGRIEDTAGLRCGLARVMRRECRRRGLSGLPVVYSLEPPCAPYEDSVPALAPEHGRHPPASIAFCPPAAGYLLAAWAVGQLLGAQADRPRGSHAVLS